MLTLEVEQVVEVTVVVEVDGEVEDDREVAQGGYITIVVVSHPVRHAVSQAVVV